MADELKLTVSGILTKGDFVHRIEQTIYSIDQTNQGFHGPIVSVGTSEEDLTVGDIGTLGWLFLRNLDATNFVQWGPKSGGAMIVLGRINPGEFALLRLEPGITLRWKADTAACKVQTEIYEN